MNSRCWGKTLIKLLNLTNSVYNFNNNGSETGKSGIKTTKESQDVGRWSRGHASRVRQGTQGMLVHKHVSSQITLTREYISMQCMLTSQASEHVRMQGMLAREHAI